MMQMYDTQMIKGMDETQLLTENDKIIKKIIAERVEARPFGRRSLAIIHEDCKKGNGHLKRLFYHNIDGHTTGIDVFRCMSCSSLIRLSQTKVEV